MKQGLCGEYCQVKEGRKVLGMDCEVMEWKCVVPSDGIFVSFDVYRYLRRTYGLHPQSRRRNQAKEQATNTNPEGGGRFV
jgi:hypothetical protein